MPNLDRPSVRFGLTRRRALLAGKQVRDGFAESLADAYQCGERDVDLPGLDLLKVLEVELHALGGTFQGHSRAKRSARTRRPSAFASERKRRVSFTRREGRSSVDRAAIDGTVSERTCC